MSDYFPLKKSAILSTAQLFSPVKSFDFNGQTVLLKQEKGVCGGGNYYIDFGVSLLPNALHIFKQNRKKIQRVLEAGTGRGVYLSFFATIPSIKSLWGVDIAPKAVRLTAENLERNGIKKFKLFAEPIEETFRGSWKVDLIAHDLPLIPMAGGNLPNHLKTMLGAGRTGRSFIDFMIKKSPSHLTEKGGLFFVQPSFIKGGKAKTRQAMKENGFKPILLKEKKKHLKETILTQKLKPLIEKITGYKFPKDRKGEYFTLQAFLGIKESPSRNN